MNIFITLGSPFYPILCMRVEDFLLELIGVKRVYFQQQGRGLLDTWANKMHASDTRDQGR